MATRCKGCGHPLRATQSIRRGYGDKCWEQLVGEVKEERERTMPSQAVREDEPTQTFILTGGEKDSLALFEEELMEKVLGKQYMPYRQMFVGPLKVMVDVDVIMYQAQQDPDEHRSCDLYEHAELFRAIKVELAEVARLREVYRDKSAEGAMPFSLEKGGVA